MNMTAFLKFLRQLLMLLGVLFILVLITASILAHRFFHAEKIGLPDHLTLMLTLAEPMMETSPPFLRSIIDGQAPPSLEDWIVALESAAEDPKVSGIIIRAVGGHVTLAQAEELRASIAHCRAANKPVFFFTDSFGEADNGTAMYYLASSASKIVLQPGGFAGFTGIAVEEPFLRGLLNKYGVLPEFEKRSAYKSAMDNLTEQHMTSADRAQLTRLLTHLSDHVMQAVSNDRKISLAKLTALRDASPLVAGDEAANVLVDSVAYEDQISLPAERISADDYLANLNGPKAARKAPHIVLIDAEGEITRGVSGGPDPVIAADDFTGMVADIIKDKHMSAVIIRLNSPGGSAIASETINRAVQRLRDSGRPVIVSMTDVAASGGYYMAAPATRILALPSTLTGSIGVIAGKISLGGLSQQYNVNWDEIAIGKHAGMFANGRGLNPEERASMARSADAVYTTFKSRVAAGRKMSPEAVEAIAQGQVWTGEEAKANGLVDELGGLVAAVKAARVALHLPEHADVVIEPYPNQESPMAVIQVLLHQLGVMDKISFLSAWRQKLSALLHLQPLEIMPVSLTY